MKDKTLLKIILFIQISTLGGAALLASWGRSQLLIVKSELDLAIYDINLIFEEISLMLPNLNSAINIVLSLEDSLAILDNINNLLTTLLGG